MPVWGFATVTESAADGVAVGENFYGYYPMASHAVLTPGAGGPGGFTDITPRRAALPPIYNQYHRVEALPEYRAGHHDYWTIFRSEEHTSELQSLMRISYAVFCLQKKNSILV